MASTSTTSAAARPSALPERSSTTETASSSSAKGAGASGADEAAGSERSKLSAPLVTKPKAEHGKLSTRFSWLTYDCMGKAVMIIGLIIVFVVLPITLYEVITRTSTERHIIAWFVGGLFALLATLISLHDIGNHLRHFGDPVLQRYMIRIMWMVPIYAVESWLSLRFKDVALYIETARECYEAYVIYSFVYLMIYFCARGNEQAYAVELAKKDPHHGAHLIPLKWCFKPWPLGDVFLFRCKVGALQYVVVRVVCTLVTFISHFAGVYCNGAMTRFDCVYIYVLLIVNASQIWAMYCLVLFYHATLSELRPIRPFPKFVCVKVVVFLSFWQAVLIAGLVHFGVIQATLSYSVSEIADGLQDFLICIEMFLVAIAHHFFYKWTDVVDEKNAPKMDFLHAFVASSLPSDVVKDTARAVRRVATPHSHGSGSPRSTDSPQAGKGGGITQMNPLHAHKPQPRTATAAGEEV